METVLQSAVVAAAVAGMVAWWCTRSARIHSVLNVRGLQVWDDAGNLRAGLWATSEEGASLWFGERGVIERMLLSQKSVCFSSDGSRVSVAKGKEGRSRSVERVHLGVEDDGAADLKLYSDVVAADWPPQLPVIVMRVSRDGDVTGEVGSDLNASLTTSLFKGAELRVNGQVVWTAGSRFRPDRHTG